eukprot:GHVH01001583.1.p1 GENE.GHVH01001583.1~~GHVH01001583.1.p1  ORF type:complete len:278 (-),score=42.82 GHVH01001583.1:1202-2035(-)
MRVLPLLAYMLGNILSLQVTFCSSPVFAEDDVSIHEAPPAQDGQKRDEEDLETSRHPLAKLVGPHHAMHWAHLPYFFVGEGDRKCFHEFVPADIIIAVPYFGNRVDQGYPCHISISDSDGMSMAHSIMTHATPVGLLHHKSIMSQQYTVCVACEKSSWMARTSAEIALKIELLTEMNDILNFISEEGSSIKGSKKKSTQQSSYQVINSHLQEAHKELEVIIELEFQELTRQAGDYNLVESMKWRITLMSMVTLACSGLTMVAVVKYLRKFFRREKVI